MLLLVLTIGVAASACGASTGGDAAAPAAETPREGGTYNYPLEEVPPLFDPAAQLMGEGYNVIHQVVEGLVRYEVQDDGTMTTVPCLAESWSGNADATVWTFKLRRGVMFHPPVSREVTADDVVACIRYISDPERQSWIAYMYAPIEGADGFGFATDGPLAVEALDRYTVRFTLAYPFAEFPDTLGAAAFWVWPADHLEKVGLEVYGTHPVGTGPYTFVRDASDTSVDLVRNPEWWDTSGGPYIDALHFEVFNSASAMWLAFQKGEIDWTRVPKGEIVASRSLPQVESGEWSVVDSPLFALGYLLVNMNDPVVGGSEGLALRQALSYGCDSRAAVDAATDGVFSPATSLVAPGVAGWDDVPSPYAYDPQKAAELGAQADPPVLELWHPIESLGNKTAEALAAGYRECGIEVRVRGMEWDRFNERVLAGEAQLFVLGWVCDYPSIDSFLYPVFESSQSGATMGIFYANEQVDELLAEARATLERQERRRIYAEAERLILAAAPVVPVFVFAEHRLFSERVANVRFDGTDMVDLWRAWVR